MNKRAMFVFMMTCLLLSINTYAEGEQDSSTWGLGDSVDAVTTTGDKFNSYNWADKVSNAFQEVYKKFRDFIETIMLIYLSITFYLKVVVFFALVILAVWIPIKLYPYYVKYYNIIRMFLDLTE